jgi:hypothetical protein
MAVSSGISSGWKNAARKIPVIGKMSRGHFQLELAWPPAQNLGL